MQSKNNNFYQFLMMILIIAMTIFTFGCQGDAPKEQAVEKIQLWNGKDFSGWYAFSKDSTLKLEDVWSVQDGVIHCLGNPFGYLCTEAVYANYKLHVEWRWANEESNSGIFLHKQDPDALWPQCIECQLKAGDAGSVGGLGGSDFNERVDKSKRFIPRKTESSEKPAGEWNMADITCKDATIEVIINGVLQNSITGVSITSGKICLQSEGKPIQFRNVTLEKL